MHLSFLCLGITHLVRTKSHTNSSQVVATAYDLSGNTTYRSAALSGIDYVLGRNALSQSYIRGYGTKDTQNVHSRLYAHELDSSVPQAPPGAMGGGANQAASDPPADDVLQGCAPMTCYVDDVVSLLDQYIYGAQLTLS